MRQLNLNRCAARPWGAAAAVAGVCVVASVLAAAGVALADEKAASDASSPSVAAQPAGAAQAGAGKPFTQSVPGTDISFQMVAIPGGTFKMGSPEKEDDRKKDEGPQVEVEVEPFYMGAHEVTWAEYEAFLQNYHRLGGLPAAERPAIPADKLADAVTYPTPMYELEAGPILDRMGRGGKFPAVIMSHYAAKQYTKWLSKKTGRFYRLPTEAEWEYAARAGTSGPYSFGDDADKLGDYAVYFENSENEEGEPGYREVGQKKPNPWGLYDMHGNVAEWCIDEYEADWYKQFAGRKVKAADVMKLAKAQVPYPRVIRGGGWESEAQDLRSAARVASDRNMNKKDPQEPKSPHWLTEGFWIGFRVVSPAREPSETDKHKYWDPDDEQTREIVTKRDREIREIVRGPGDSKQAAAK